MRDFSRSVMRHYGPSETGASPVSPAPAPRWSTGLQSPLPGLQPERVQRTSAEPTPDPREYTEQPLLPIDPIATATPPVAEYVPREVFVAQPRTDAPVQRSAEGGDSTQHTSANDLPSTYMGSAIPVDSSPVDPALKRHMQQTRERQARVQRNRENKLESLMSEVPEPPAPEETATHSGRRIRPRGHIGVEYVQTKALADKREPSDAAQQSSPVQTPRESEPKPETVQRSASSADDDEGSTASKGDVGTDVMSVQRAIEAAEALGVASDAPVQLESEQSLSDPEPALRQQPAGAPPLQRAISVDEALDFHDEQSVDTPALATSALQRTPDQSSPVPFDKPSITSAPDIDTTTTSATGATAGSSVQRTTDEVTTSAVESSVEDAIQAVSAPEAARSPSVQRAPDVSGPVTFDDPGDVSVPDDSATTTPVTAAPAGSSVQRTADEVTTPAAESSVEGVIRAVSAPETATSPSVQRAPDVSGPVPFDEPAAASVTDDSVATTPAPAVPTGSSVQRTADEVTTSAAESSVEDAIRAVSAPEAARSPSVQRAPDVSGPVPFDEPAAASVTDDSATTTPVTAAPAGSSVQRTADEVTTSAAEPSVEDATRAVSAPEAATSPSVQRTPDVSGPVPFDEPGDVSVPDDSATTTPATAAPVGSSVQRTAEGAATSAAGSSIEDAIRAATTPEPASPSAQRAPDMSVPVPFDEPGDVSVPDDSAATTPATTAPAGSRVQRTADEGMTPAADSSVEDAIRAVSASEAATSASVQRAPDVSGPVPFDEPAAASVPNDSAATTPATAAPVGPSVQRTAEDAATPVSESLVEDAIRATSTPEPASPSVQRAADMSVPVPFDEPGDVSVPDDSAATTPAPAAPVGPSVQRTVVDAATPVSEPSVEDAIRAASAPEAATSQNVQRAPDVSGPVQFDKPVDALEPDIDTTAPAAAAPAGSSIQRTAEDGATPVSEPSVEDAIRAASTPEPASPSVQRTPDVSVPVPFDEPAAASVPDIDSTMPPSTAPVVPSVQRTAVDTKTPVSEPSVEDAIRAVSAPEAPAPPSVQGASDVSGPVPFDEPAAASVPDIDTTIPSSTAPVVPNVQRTADDAATPAAEPSIEDVAAGIDAAQAPAASTVQRAADMTPPLPFDEVIEPPPAAERTGESPVQRKTNTIDGQVFAVSSPVPPNGRTSAHPTGRPQAENGHGNGGSRPIQRTPERSQETRSSGPEHDDTLPFDRVEPPRVDAPPVQRTPERAATPNPFAGMDLRQAMIAAGMITPPPAERAGESTAGAPIQREPSDGESYSTSDTSQASDDNGSKEELDVDKLARDVMRILRSRIRSEADRLTGLR